jgi:hypothetical protein
MQVSFVNEVPGLHFEDGGGGGKEMVVNFDPLQPAFFIFTFEYQECFASVSEDIEDIKLTQSTA